MIELSHRCPWTIELAQLCVQLCRRQQGPRYNVNMRLRLRGRWTLSNLLLLRMCTFPQISHFLSSNSPDWTLFFHFLPPGRLWLRSMRACVCKYKPLCDASLALKRLQICGKTCPVYERLSGNSAPVCKHHLFIYLFKNVHSSLRACLFGGVKPSLTQLWGLHLWRSAMKA